MPPTPIYQAGFQAGRSAYEHIFVVRRILDEAWRAGAEMHVLAMDIRAAFPWVLHEQVIRVLQLRGVPVALINRIASLALHDNTR